MLTGYEWLDMLDMNNVARPYLQVYFVPPEVRFKQLTDWENYADWLKSRIPVLLNAYFVDYTVLYYNELCKKLENPAYRFSYKSLYALYHLIDDKWFPPDYSLETIIDFYRNDSWYYYNGWYRLPREVYNNYCDAVSDLFPSGTSGYAFMVITNLNTLIYEIYQYLDNYNMDWPNTQTRINTQENNHLLFDHSFLEFDQAVWNDMKTELENNQAVEAEPTSSLWMDLLNTALVPKD